MIDTRWRKSTYSGNQGGNCLEVMVWCKSSYSGNQEGACVEVASWHRSSYSDQSGGECVEAATLNPHIGIRDSKDLAQGVLTTTPTSWSALLATLTTPAA